MSNGCLKYVFSLFTKYKGIYGTCICIWPVELLLKFSVALVNAWKSRVQCHSHKKCPVSVNYYFCLLDLPLLRSMLKCLSVIVDLPVSLCISQSTCFIYFEVIVRCIDSWFVVECSFIHFLKFAFVSVLFILNSILSAIKYFQTCFL